MNTSPVSPKWPKQAGKLSWWVSLCCLVASSVLAPLHAEDYYLQPQGDPNIFDHVPVATMTEWAPFMPFLVNYDPARDATEGLLIQKGGLNFQATDPLKYQTWVLPGVEPDLNGPLSLTLWVAMKNFDTSGKRGKLYVHLVECDPDGGNCANIDVANLDTTAWTGGWDAFSFDYGDIVHTIPAGRRLGLKAIVASASDDDMMLAYGTAAYPGKISVTTTAPVSNDVNLSIVKSANRSWSYVGTSTTYTLQYNCVSTIAAGQGVTITDTLDPFMTVTGITNSPHIASSNYDPGTNTVSFTFVDPLPAGSAGDVQIVAEFIPGVSDDYIAPNTASISAVNGIDQVSNVVNLRAEVPSGGPGDPTGGAGYFKGVYFNKFASSSDIELPFERVYYDIKHGNTGGVGDDIENYVIEDHFPPELKLWRFNVGEFYGTIQTLDVYYQLLGSSSWIPWPSSPFNTDNDDSNQYASSLGLPVTTYVTALRFDYGTLPGGVGFHPNNYDRMDIDLEMVDPSTMVIGSSVTNCANQTGNDVAGPDAYDNDACDDVIVKGPDAKYYWNLYDATGGSPYAHGETVRMGILLGSRSTNGVPLVNPTLATLLPEGFVYQVGSESVTGTAYTENGSPPYTVEVIDSFAGTPRQLVRFKWASFTIPANGSAKIMRVELDMSIQPEATFEVHQAELYGSWDSPADGDGVSWRVTDTWDYDGDGDVTEKVAKDTRNFWVGDAGSGIASLDSVMWVKGELDAGFSRYPDSGLTVPSGQADYELRITNTGGVALKELTVIEILPHIGDRGVVDLSERNSEWAPFLVGAVAAPAGVDVFYSTSGNPCRDELTPGLPAGCEAPGWMATLPADASSVLSLKFVHQDGRWLIQGEEMVIAWPMRAPINAPTSGQIAWSSFGVVGTRADNDLMMLPSEPMKVGIGIQPPQPPFFGDYVWRDENRDGIQDPGEAGINGVRVELYNDDGDGVADPSVDPMYGFTVTSNDGSEDGKYLFSYFPPGDYYLVFYPPAGYLVSSPGAGPDDVDSDGLATMIGSNLVAITEITTVSILEIDLDWDQGFYDRAALPAVWAIADLGGGGVVIGGKFQSSHGTPCGNIAVLGPDGSPSGAFNSGSGFNGIVRALAVTDDGKILAGGEFTSYNGHPANGLALLGGDGGWISGLAMPNTADVRWVGSTGSKFYIAGEFSSLGGQSAPRIGRLNSDGSVDGSFAPGAGADGPIRCGAIYGGGVIVGGSFSSYRGEPAPCLAMINADGSRNSGFDIGAGFDGPVNSITLKGGMIFAVGDFTECDGRPVDGSARLTMSGSADPSFGNSGLSVDSNRASN